MTPEECAEFLGIKINTLYVMTSQGRISYRKVGHLLRFDFDEIVEWTKREVTVGKDRMPQVLFDHNLCGCNRRTEMMSFDN